MKVTTAGLVFISLCILLATPALAGRTPIIQTEPSVIYLEDFTPGSVIAQGQHQDGVCVGLDELTLALRAETDLEKWSMVSATDDCALVLDALWEGSLEDGPKHLLDALSDGSRKETAEVFGADNGPAPMFVTTCKTNSQAIYTFGGGGPIFDKLTRVDHTVQLCWNGSTVWVASLSGVCTATAFSPPLHSWLTDFCGTNNQNLGPTVGTAYHGARGNFHCGPVTQWPCNQSNPDGYYHHLISTISGTPSGTISCNYSWGGIWVNGPVRTVLQGCN